MRIIWFIDETGRERRGDDSGDGTALIIDGDLFSERRRTQPSVRITKLLAPIIPTDIICVGRNYRAASTDAGSDQREDPDRATATNDQTLEVFLKPSTALQHPIESILIPRFDGLDANLDCEGELAVVIARDTRNIREAEALDCVLGYTIANDVTARAFQTLSGGGPPLWMRGKGFDTFCPLGPAIVTRDEISDPQNLSIRTIINGQIVRDGHTSQMIRTVPQIIAALSRHMTLRQGAVILTGAPPANTTGRPLRDGDSVCVRIAGLSELTNTIRHRDASPA